MLPQTCHAVRLEFSHERDFDGSCCRFWLCSVEITVGTSNSAAAEQGLEYCAFKYGESSVSLLSDSFARLHKYI